MKRIYLIDCPGVVPPSNNDTPEDILLRGVVRVENVQNPEQYIAALLKKVKPQHIERTYGIKDFDSPTHFLSLLARKGGRLLRGGEADVDGVAKMVLNDFLRGKIPWFTPPPVLEGQEEKDLEGRKGALGEMGKIDIVKAGTAQDGDESLVMEDDDDNDLNDNDDEDEDDFEGFDGEDHDDDDEMSSSHSVEVSDDEAEDASEVDDQMSGIEADDRAHPDDVAIST